MQQWYALHTKVYAEQIAERELHRHGIETYLPEISSNSGKSGKPAVKRKAFFPGYLFMNVDLNELSPSTLRWAVGVRHIVTYGDKPIAVPAEIIGLIRRQLAEQEASAASKKQQRFKKGDYVRIADGPFGDVLAIFEGASSASDRVTVLMEFLGRISRVKVDIDSLEAIDSGGHKTAGKPRRRTRGRGRPIRYAD